MPITEDRMLRLLVAAEDFEQALGEATTVVAHAAKVAALEGHPAAQRLDELALMLQKETLLRQPIGSSLALASERQHWTEARLKYNAKHRRRQSLGTHSDD